jgi:hypothetical protein
MTRRVCASYGGDVCNVAQENGVAAANHVLHVIGRCANKRVQRRLTRAAELSAAQPAHDDSQSPGSVNHERRNQHAVHAFARMFRESKYQLYQICGQILRAEYPGHDDDLILAHQLEYGTFISISTIAKRIRARYDALKPVYRAMGQFLADYDSGIFGPPMIVGNDDKMDGVQIASALISEIGPCVEPFIDIRAHMAAYDHSIPPQAHYIHSKCNKDAGASIEEWVTYFTQLVEDIEEICKGDHPNSWSILSNDPKTRQLRPIWRLIRYFINDYVQGHFKSWY